jgi:hypothetical protein
MGWQSYSNFIKSEYIPHKVKVKQEKQSNKQASKSSQRLKG